MVAKTKTNSKALKFAALIRVSTERQESKGESLRTQTTAIKKNVELLEGVVAEWYGGAEHATPGWEKKEVNRLLLSAQKKSCPFNAVIVMDADRWSRDNEQHEKGIRTFKKHAIKFFVGVSEYNLYDPTHNLFLNMSTIIGQFHAQNQARKSMLNKIHRAKRGCPTCGNLPIGRTFNKETEKWGIDENSKAMIVDAADRYLKGERLADIALEYGIDHSGLHRTLTDRCGIVWQQSFNSDDLNIHQDLEITIPRLLAESTIQAIRKKAKANKTYTHGKIKNDYLLSRMIFCGHCNYALFGQTALGKYSYYRHGSDKNKKTCCRPKTKSNQVKADVIEDAVIRYLFKMFGDPLTVKRAIEKATPNLKRLEEERERINFIEKELQKIQIGRDRILSLIIKEKLTESQASKELDKLQVREVKLTIEQQRLQQNQENNPTAEQIKEVSEKVSKQFKRSVRVSTAKRRSISKAWFEKMTYEDKRNLCETIFSGRNTDGSRMGIYIEWDNKGRWSFDIRGHLIDKGNLLSDTTFNFDEGEVGSKQKELLSKKTSY